MNDNIQFAIGKLQEANTAASTAEFNLAEATAVYDASSLIMKDARDLVYTREQELVKAVRENMV